MVLAVEDESGFCSGLQQLDGAFGNFFRAAHDFLLLREVFL